jgi:hypothetical protein
VINDAARPEGEDESWSSRPSRCHWAHKIHLPDDDKGQLSNLLLGGFTDVMPTAVAPNVFSIPSWVVSRRTGTYYDSHHKSWAEYTHES